MDEERTKLTVTIGGEEYVLKGAAPPEHLQRVAALVDGKVREFMEKSPRGGTTRALVLAALVLADDYLRLKDEMAAMTTMFEEEWQKRHKRAQ